jgi:uracil-DNA glycosylase family 4
VSEPDRDRLRAHLASHLELYAEMGVEGISRDPAWSGRMSPRADQPPPRLRRSAEALRAKAEARGRREPESEARGFPHTDIVARGLEPAGPAASLFDDAPAEEAPAREAADQLRDIREDIGDCTRCKLHGLGRRQIVFGVGNPHARLMFVGEAPGRDEDEQGEPFVGRAGQLLTKIIQAMGLQRSDVYIANVLKCRPPDNRNPEPDEVATCEPFLFRQIDAIRPRVIVALGTFAVRTLLQTQAPISRLRGRVYPFRGAQLVPTFHPAFLLRNPESKKDTWEDMKVVMGLLNE